MRTKVADTSLFAFQGVKPVLGLRQRQMYMVFRRYSSVSFSDELLAKNLGWPINCVTPRRNELAAKGLIERYKKLRNGAGRQVWFWRLRQ